ncbi:IS200/IS605 family transposase [Aquisphaera insulae]|uniref:IS200/IS605 family transposase n=1 Tax=Aquisphaera insulae TaxID=2712864 RepID=UPI0013E9C752|nr:IS200/IS605 family transposase [Aquisphaera insulae]
MRPTYMTTRLIEDPRAVRQYDLGGHTHYRLDYHFVWRVRFNRKVLGQVLSPILVDLIDSICLNKGVKLLGLAVAADHVHLCARLRPAHAPSQVMRWIKTNTSKELFERFPHLESRFGSRRFWGRGYHVETLGDRPVFAILAYIGKQDDHHDLRALEAHFAEVDEFLTTAAMQPDDGPRPGAEGDEWD